MHGRGGHRKTRLAEEAAAAAAARGIPAVWARAADPGSSPPYGLWRLALDEPVIRGDGEGGSRPDLWAQVLGNTGQPPLAEGADSGSASRFALFAEVRRRLAEAAEPAGLLLVFDDLQWADQASAKRLPAPAGAHDGGGGHHGPFGIKNLPLGSGEVMKKLLELLVCFLHPVAVILIWIDLASRSDLSGGQKLAWGLFGLIPLVPFVYVLTGGDLW